MSAVTELPQPPQGTNAATNKPTSIQDDFIGIVPDDDARGTVLANGEVAECKTPLLSLQGQKNGPHRTAHPDTLTAAVV